MAIQRIHFLDLFLWTPIMWNMALHLAATQHCRPLQVLPGVDLTTYKLLGDINIGVFVAASQSSGLSTCLDPVLRGSSLIEQTEAVVYAVKSVNDNPQILPNITLGFVQVNDCSNDNVALAVALTFLPRVTYKTQDDGVCANNTYPTSSSQDVRATSDPCTEMPFYDIIGAIAPSTSQRTLAVSKLFAATRTPIIGCSATSDELSDKQRHPYFARMIPSDKYLVNAVLQFSQNNNWSYVSVVYVKDSYGQRAYDHLKEEAPSLGMCIAAAQRIDETSNFDAVVSELNAYPKARIVFLFLYSQYMTNLITSANKSSLPGQFIWIWSDSWNSFKNLPLEVKSAMLGSFSIGLYSRYVNAYLKYLRHINVLSTTNPWFRTQWEDLAGCSLDDLRSCDPHFNVLTSSKFGFEKTSSVYIDAVNVFATAAHELISDLCPNATGLEARACITGERLINYVRNISFIGENGRIEFDENGDSKGKYEIRQFVFDYNDVTVVNVSYDMDYVAKTVAVYDVDTNMLSFTTENISWIYLVHEDQSRVVEGDVSVVGAPESLCSKPCGVGEYRIMLDQKCCWECLACRDNEKVTNNGTKCELCEILSWPDKATGYTSCSVIPPTYPLVTDTVPIILICLATVALVGVSLVAVGYIQFRDSRIIKAASRELSIAKMVAIFVGYVTVILFQTTPTHTMCGAIYFMFCLSFSLIYASLLVKTIRIYRIFQSGKMNNKRPRLISPCSQLAMAGVLIAVQMLICTFIYIFYSPTAVSTQPVRTEMFVELSCDITSPGLVSFLAYNLILVLLCSIFAFKTRQLPDNFNESKFISMCVSTTLVIWMAFVPTYFTSNRSTARVMLLSTALLLNHTVALLFLFLPKLYASVYVPMETFFTSRFQTTIATTDMSRQSCSNQVSPSPSTNTNSLKIAMR